MMLMLLGVVTTTVSRAVVQGDSTLTTVANYFGIIGGALLVLGAGYVGVQWVRWRNPVAISFLIPKASYAEKTFAGAPEDEDERDSITVGIGRYEIIVNVTAKLDMEILQARVALDELGKGIRPVITEAPPSRFLREVAPDHLGRHQYVDWNGELKTSEEFDFPREVLGGHTGLVTRIIETRGPWEGEIAVMLALRGRFARPVHKKLKFTVDPNSTELAFLEAPRRVTAQIEVIEVRDMLEGSIWILCLSVDNHRAAQVNHVSINLRVPDTAYSLFPCDREGGRISENNAIHAPEILTDDTGQPVGSGIFYWSIDGFHFPGRWTTEKCFSVHMPNRGPFPIRTTISSPDLHDQIELSGTIYRPDESE